MAWLWSNQQQIGWSNDQVAIHTDFMMKAKDAEITRLNDSIRQLNEANDARIQQLIEANNTRIQRLNDRMIDAAGENGRLRELARSAQRKLADHESARDIRGTIEALSRGKWDHLGKRGFPGVQACLDQCVLTDPAFKKQMEDIGARHGTDMTVLTKRFKNIYDTLSKEHHGGTDQVQVPTSKFACIGDRLVVICILEYFAYPYDVIKDDHVAELTEMIMGT
jgi:hypothetical protein